MWFSTLVKLKVALSGVEDSLRREESLRLGNWVALWRPSQVTARPDFSTENSATESLPTHALVDHDN